MSQTYTHDNVPEEIAKKFPHLQGKKMVTKDQVPVHVLESVQKTGKPVIVHHQTHQQPAHQQQHPVVGQKAPISHPALHKSVVHHSTTTKPVLAQKPAVVPGVVSEAPQGQIHILGKEHDATTKIVAPIQHPVHQTIQQRPVHNVIGHSQVKVGNQVTHKAAFTHENVPEDVHKRFPHLQNKATIKVGANGTTIKSPEKVVQPKINVNHASEHQQEQHD